MPEDSTALSGKLARDYADMQIMTFVEPPQSDAIVKALEVLERKINSLTL